MKTLNSLSIIIPVFNEEKYIEELLHKLIELQKRIKNFETKIVVVNDGSTDKTSQKLQDFKNLVSIYEQKNQGKGSAVQYGIEQSRSDWILIQDGDLEYNPNDILNLLSVLDNSSSKVAVYGSRYKSTNRFIFKRIKNQKLGPYVMNIVLSLICFFLLRIWLTDTLTGYKVYRREFFEKNVIESRGFEADHEITCKLVNNKYSIVEVPISYSPRSKLEGKKIRFSDGIKAIIVYLKYFRAKENT